MVSIAIEEFPDLTGGVRGLKLATPELAGWTLSSAALYYFVLGVTVLAIRAGWGMQRSRYGRAFDAVRQSAIVAQALGHLARAHQAPGVFHRGRIRWIGRWIIHRRGRLHRSDRIRHLGVAPQITFIVVGGLGSVCGSVVGAVALTLLPEALARRERI